MDYRRDIRTKKEVSLRDLYLLNYLAIYLLYLLFHGEGSGAGTRDFITKEDFILLFNQHCESVTKTDLNDETVLANYSENFLQLAHMWLGKIEGEYDSRKMAEKYGCINRLLAKFRADGLFEEQGEDIHPTDRLRDLMPYFLRKSNLTAINNWIAQERKRD